MECRVKSGLKIANTGKEGVKKAMLSAPCEMLAAMPGHRTKDPYKPASQARAPGTSNDTRSDKEIAVDVGRIALGESGKGEGYQLMTKRAPVPHQQLWQKHDVVPRAIDREVAKSFYESTPGVDRGCDALMMYTSRISLADGRGGAAPATVTYKSENPGAMWRVS
jgi:carbon-monoxide dehydrogenase catalytic subunit